MKIYITAHDLLDDEITTIQAPSIAEAIYILMQLYGVDTDMANKHVNDVVRYDGLTRSFPKGCKQITIQK